MKRYRHCIAMISKIMRHPHVQGEMWKPVANKTDAGQTHQRGAWHQSSSNIVNAFDAYHLFSPDKNESWVMIVSTHTHTAPYSIPAFGIKPQIANQNTALCMP
eukprot:scaffold388_cov114-Cylindrotheca_fusiformis.AAC.4